MNPAEQQQASEQPESLAKSLEQTWDDLEAQDTVEEEETEELEATEEEPVAEIEDPVEETEEQVASEEEQEVEASEEVEDDNWDEPAPERWPAEMKEAYSKLDKPARKLLLEGVFKPMQRTYTQTTQELAEMRQQMDPMLQTMQQHSDTLKGMGLDPAEAFRRQMAWAGHFARVGPEQGIRDMADAYGINKNGSGQEQAPDEYLTPVERAMKQKLDSLEQHLQQQQHMTHEQQQQAQQAEIGRRADALRQELQSFVSEEKDGKLAHPHVDKVGHAMAGLVRGGLVEKFDEYGQPIPVRQQIAQAYTIACNMDPSLRTTSPSRQEQMRLAKRANQTVTSKSEELANPMAGPLRDSISDIYDQLDKRSTRR